MPYTQDQLAKISDESGVRTQIIALVLDAVDRLKMGPALLSITSHGDIAATVGQLATVAPAFGKNGPQIATYLSGAALLLELLHNLQSTQQAPTTAPVGSPPPPGPAVS